MLHALSEINFLTFVSHNLCICPNMKHDRQHLTTQREWIEFVSRPHETFPGPFIHIDI